MMEEQSKQLSSAVNSGAVAIEQERAVAQAKGKLVLARQFPRDMVQVEEDLIKCCKLPSLADVAFYSVPRGDKKLVGPSIRLAEEIARICGNIEYGHRELSRSADKSEIEVYAWDMQTNVTAIRQLTVPHVLDTKSGPRKLRDQKDVDDLIANKASKQLRGRILAIVPKWLLESAMAECKRTIVAIGANGKSLEERAQAMTVAFNHLGVPTEKLVKWLGHDLKTITADEFIELKGIHNAIKLEGARASDYFDAKEEPATITDATSVAGAVASLVAKAPVTVVRNEPAQTEAVATAPVAVAPVATPAQATQPAPTLPPGAAF